LLNAGNAVAAAAVLGAAVDGFCLLAETAPTAARAQLRASRAALELAEAAATAGAAAVPPDPARLPNRYARQWHDEVIRYRVPRRGRARPPAGGGGGAPAAPPPPRAPPHRRRTPRPARPRPRRPPGRGKCQQRPALARRRRRSAPHPHHPWHSVPGPPQQPAD